MPPITLGRLQPLLRTLDILTPRFLYGVLALITLKVTIFHKADLYWDRLTSDGDFEDIFDFIIAGGGSSGAVLAYRLSEDFKVLLLEAGGEPFKLARDIPISAFLLWNQPYYDWQYLTTPQDNACYGNVNNQCYWPRGKGLGGSSNLNNMIYSRSSVQDFENWANITGDDRWGWSNVLRLFKKSEDYGVANSNSIYHSVGGQLKVNLPNYKGMSDYFLKAGEEFGWVQTDLNAPFTQGFDRIVNTQDEMGKRWSTFKGFIQPARASHPRLTIRKFATVNKVLLRGLTAYGVEYERHGRLRRAMASKEVILSAGSIGSPKILMMSGIGPREHLEELGVPLVADLPVGKNLQDHILALGGPFIIDQPLTLHPDRIELRPKTLLDFYQRGEGVLTATGTMAMAFLTSERAKAAGQIDWPDFQWFFVGVSTNAQFGKIFERIFNFLPGIWSNFLTPSIDSDSFQICSVLSRPQSRGEMKLDPISKEPLLNPRYLEDPSDLQVMVEAIKRSVDLVEGSDSFGAIGARLMDSPFPNCKGYPFRSDVYWECYIRHTVFTVFHPVGTCSMGRGDSEEAVVDSKLRVRKLSGLRVIDASIMPVIPIGNTNAPSIMIGEMGAELLMDKWRKWR